MDDTATITLRQAIGAHIQADAYRDTFPDSEDDAKYLRRQETWWRLKARQWLSEAESARCAAAAKYRAADEHPLAERI